jgi:hypothetical protein
MAEDPELRDLFEAAAKRGHHCRIVYRDTLGEHHAVMALPNACRIVDGVTWAFFLSESGEDMEVRLEDIVAIEPRA